MDRASSLGGSSRIVKVKKAVSRENRRSLDEWSKGDKMTTGFSVDFLWYPVGTDEFLHSFFSTISYHLEPEGWGTRFPYLMNHLYQGKLRWSDVPKAMKEVEEVRKLLENFKPSDVVWDIDNLEKKPPWGDNISSDITSLANYFVTSSGEDLFDVLIKALKNSYSEKIDIEIQTL
jgi:hypothetical protein